MRPATRIQSTPTARTIAAGVPAAVAGSIAIALTASPAAAHADVRDTEVGMAQPALRALPAAPASTANAAAATALAAPAMTAVTAAPAPATASLRASATASPRTYTVVRGDTISAIAARHGLRTADVLAINGFSWRTVIFPGQVITLTGATSSAAAGSSSPTAGAASATYTVTAGDTISAIAKKHGVSTTKVLTANKLGWSSIIYPGQKLTIPGKAALASNTTPAPTTTAPPTSAAPAAASGTYTVAAGDTVSSIAKKHGMSTTAVLTANKLGWSSIIYPGQKLTIPSTTGLDAPQTENARLIIQVGRELGVPDKGIAIALGTAMQESWIRNLDWGDRDSLGLFQQRPSTGWGTADQVRDRVRSIKAFYGGPSDPNGSRTRGLLDIPGWQSMSFADAAQAVQISAYPERYAKWEKPAYAWLAALG